MVSATAGFLQRSGVFLFSILGIYYLLLAADFLIDSRTASDDNSRQQLVKGQFEAELKSVRHAELVKQGLVHPDGWANNDHDVDVGRLVQGTGTTGGGGEARPAQHDGGALAAAAGMLPHAAVDWFRTMWHQDAEEKHSEHINPGDDAGAPAQGTDARLEEELYLLKKRQELALAAETENPIIAAVRKDFAWRNDPKNMVLEFHKTMHLPTGAKFNGVLKKLLYGERNLGGGSRIIAAPFLTLHLGDLDLEHIAAQRASACLREGLRGLGRVEGDAAEKPSNRESEAQHPRGSSGESWAHLNAEYNLWSLE